MKVMYLRAILLGSVLAIAAFGQLLPSQSGITDEIKAAIAKLVQERRADKPWMTVKACPADLMPAKGRRPSMVSGGCITSAERCLDECNLKNGDACYYLANLIQQHDTIENDVAEVLYQRSCDLGIVSGCTNRAAAIFNRKEKKGSVCAANTFRKACSQDDPWACGMYGLALAEGVGIRKDIPAAVVALKKACKVSREKNGEACRQANELRELIDRTIKPK